jgi:hypothetical protein
MSGAIPPCIEFRLIRDEKTKLRQAFCLSTASFIFRVHSRSPNNLFYSKTHYYRVKKFKEGNKNGKYSMHEGDEK